MLQQIFLVGLTIGLVYSACLCPQSDKPTEYCGTDLNSIVPNNDCPKKMYLCASNNANKEAALLVDCGTGKECDRKVFGKYFFFGYYFRFLFR